MKSERISPFWVNGYQPFSARIYSYIAAMKKNHTAQMEFSHGIWFFDNPEYWNLTSEWVFPLVAFLRQHFH